MDSNGLIFIISAPEFTLKVEINAVDSVGGGPFIHAMTSSISPSSARVVMLNAELHVDW